MSGIAIPPKNTFTLSDTARCGLTELN